MKERAVLREWFERGIREKFCIGETKEYCKYCISSNGRTVYDVDY